MPRTLWIQPLESRLPFPLSDATHLEVEVDESLFRCINLARNWFAASPEPLLERQSFGAEVNLLEHTIGGEAPVGVLGERPAGLEPSFEELSYAYLHVARTHVWFEVCTKRDEVLETPPVAFEALPVLEPGEAVKGNQEQITQVTLALEITILHEGAFTGDAIEELLHNLDFALEQQRDSASLAPESLDGVTQDFVFRDLDVRPGLTQPIPKSTEA